MRIVTSKLLSPVYTSEFYLTNFVCQRYFARVDDKFVTNLLRQMHLNKSYELASFFSFDKMHLIK
jgi:hypothetical protein